MSFHIIYQELKPQLPIFRLMWYMLETANDVDWQLYIRHIRSNIRSSDGHWHSIQVKKLHGIIWWFTWIGGGFAPGGTLSAGKTRAQETIHTLQAYRDWTWAKHNPSYFLPQSLSRTPHVEDRYPHKHRYWTHAHQKACRMLHAPDRACQIGHGKEINNPRLWQP